MSAATRPPHGNEQQTGSRNRSRVVGATRTRRGAGRQRTEPHQILDYAADACGEGELSPEACQLILAWWTTPQLTPRDLLELGVSRLRLREAIMFLQSMPERLRARLAEAIPSAQEPVLLPAWVAARTQNRAGR